LARYEGDYEMLRFSGCKQVFFEGFIDLRHIGIEDLRRGCFFENINVVDRGAEILPFDERKSVLLFGRTPTLKCLPHSCDLFEIFCPALGGPVPTDLARASYNQAIRNRFAAVWTSEHERSLETTSYFVNRESFTRCKESARREQRSFDWKLEMTAMSPFRRSATDDENTVDQSRGKS
jgi:hypothetical protein